LANRHFILFLFLHSALSVFSWDGVNFHKKLGEDTDGTADPN